MSDTVFIDIWLNIKEQFKGVMLWVLLLVLGLFIPIISFQRSGNKTSGLIIFIVYSVLIGLMGCIVYFQKYQIGASTDVIRCDISSAHHIEELDKMLYIEHHTLLEILKAPNISQYDDFHEYTNRVFEDLEEKTIKKLEYIHKQSELIKKYGKTTIPLNPTSKEEKFLKKLENIDKKTIHLNDEITKEQIHGWLENKFGKIQIEKLPTNIYVYLCQLKRSHSFESTPLQKYKTVLLILRRPYGEEFDMSTRYEFIDDYYIRCKTVNVKFVRFPDINSNIPCFYCNYSPTDSKNPLDRALSANQIINIEFLAMQQIIAMQRMEYQDYYKQLRERDDMLQRKEEEIKNYQATIVELQLEPMFNLVKNTKITKKQKIWPSILVSIFLTIFFTIGIIAIIMNQRSKMI